jgi:hypothetical protein
MKKLIISATLIAIALGSGAILAAQGEHNHDQTQKPGASANRPMKGEHGQHGQGQEHMAQKHARMGTHMAQRGEHAGHGKAGENCPMHEQKKAS